MSAAGLTAAAPANAAPIETYAIYGQAGIESGDAADPNFYSPISAELIDNDDQLVDDVTTEYDGYFSFQDVPDGDYTLVLDSTDDDAPTEERLVPVTVEGNDVDLELELLEPLPSFTPGVVTITGTVALGETLTASVTPFSPTGANMSYEWFYTAGEYASGVDGATGTTLVLTEDLVGFKIGFLATAKGEGFTPTRARAITETAVSAPQQAPVAAPVADSSGLAAYLASKEVTTEGPEFAGLPAGGLDPAKSYKADMPWYYGDSFVDVYLYSSPVFVGTFPVVDGVAQITLSPAILASLAAGTHTLVSIGQTSGGVQSVSLSITAVLASTGFDPVLPLGGAVALLVLGSGLFIARRRLAVIRGAAE